MERPEVDCCTLSLSLSLPLTGFETLVSHAVVAAHCCHHFLSQAHWRRTRLWIQAKNEAEIDVEKMACLSQHKIVEVAVPNCKQVSHHAVTRQRLDKGLVD